MDFVREILEPLSRSIDDHRMEPDPARTDWVGQRPALEELRRLSEQLVTAMREMGLPKATGPGVPADDVIAAVQAEPLLAVVASLVGEVAAVHHAAGDGAALTLLDRAESVAPEGVVRDELRAARVDVGTYARLVRARWLQRHGRFEDADAILRPMLKTVREPGLLAGLRTALDAPRPLSSAPPLFRLNGFGAGLYGERDHASDGSFVSTYCISALWIPIFPLGAYRVRRPAHNRYEFFAKVPLSGFARGSRWALAAAIVLAIAIGSITSYLDSPRRLGAIALSEARAAEQAGRKEQAAAAYLDAAVSYAYAVPRARMEGAVDSFVRLASTRIEEPATPSTVEPAAALVHEYERAPAFLRGRAARRLSGTLERWAGQAGGETPERAAASLRLLELAAHVAPEADKTRIEGRSRTIRRGMALRIADDFPVEALGQLLAAGEDPETRQAAGTILQDLARSPSLLAVAEPDARAWLEAAEGDAATETTASAVRAALEAHDAAAADPARQEALESGDERKLAALAKRSPDDQQIATALADALRGKGDAAAARALLEGLGPVGRLVPDARRQLAVTLMDLDQLAEADALLDRVLAVELTPFQEARTALNAASDALRERLIRQAEQGDLPDEVRRRLMFAQEGEAAAVFLEWAGPQIAADPELQRLRAGYSRTTDVVPTALLSGMIKLRRATDARGEERDRILADAQRVFLAIQQEAGDDPSYQLGLAQVYHRLGRTEDGEQAMREVLDRGDPQLGLAVAHAYRELGLVTRAREVATQIHETAESPAREQAAKIMFLLSSRDEDQERWLRAADQNDPFVQVSLVQAEAARLVRAGDLAKAERKFAEAARRFGRNADHDPADANNAALAWEGRYLCTGDPADLRRAIDGLEAARRTLPDNALILGNLGRTLSYAATIEVLDRWVRTRVLRLDRRSADDLLSALEDGPEREAVLAAARASALQRRALDVLRQQETLAPRDASTWREELEAHGRADDVAGLRALSERIGAIADLDTSESETRSAYEERADDARFLEDVDAAIRLAEQTLAAAEASHHAPTIAAAAYLLGLVRSAKVPLSGAIEDADAARALLARADETWPSLGASHALAWSLVTVAELKAAPRSEALAYLLREEQRHYDADVLLHRAMKSPDGSAIVAALRQQAELREAAALRRSHPSALPKVSDWVLGRVAEDRELERTAKPSLQREDERLTRHIEAVLRPGAPGPRAAEELLSDG